jgi:hypothetical protein
MPHIEGFGKQTFPKEPEKGDSKRIFFFKPQSEPQESKPMFCCNII